MKKSYSVLTFLLISFGLFQMDLSGQSQSPLTGGEARLASWKTHMQMKANSKFKNLEWRAVGPEQQGGRIETIACHPDEPYTIYVGAGSGGLWKSNNHGTTWTPIFDDQPTFAMGSIAIAPSDPDVLWLGTGEVLMARSSYSGLGVFKSVDAGKSWQHMGLADSYHIPKVVIDPKDPNTVYAAALGHNYSYNEERGVFKTTNGGKSWKKSLYISEKVGFVDIV
ncbi:MAG: glycosyl hydrolase, partial [Saprospiraceae bacterium]|nr:glycosyl hydrolase [Saprospiraceae bacterium]